MAAAGGLYPAPPAPASPSAMNGTVAPPPSRLTVLCDALHAVAPSRAALEASSSLPLALHDAVLSPGAGTPASLRRVLLELGLLDLDEDTLAAVRDFMRAHTHGHIRSDATAVSHALAAAEEEAAQADSTRSLPDLMNAYTAAIAAREEAKRSLHALTHSPAIHAHMPASVAAYLGDAHVLVVAAPDVADRVTALARVWPNARARIQTHAHAIPCDCTRPCEHAVTRARGELLLQLRHARTAAAHSLACVKRVGETVVATRDAVAGTLTRMRTHVRSALARSGTILPAEAVEETAAELRSLARVCARREVKSGYEAALAGIRAVAAAECSAVRASASASLAALIDETYAQWEQEARSLQEKHACALRDAKHAVTHATAANAGLSELLSLKLQVRNHVTRGLYVRVGVGDVAAVPDAAPSLRSFGIFLTACVRAAAYSKGLHALLSAYSVSRGSTLAAMKRSFHSHVRRALDAARGQGDGHARMRDRIRARVAGGNPPQPSSAMATVAGERHQLTRTLALIAREYGQSVPTPVVSTIHMLPPASGKRASVVRSEDNAAPAPTPLAAVNGISARMHETLSQQRPAAAAIFDSAASLDSLSRVEADAKQRLERVLATARQARQSTPPPSSPQRADSTDTASNGSRAVHHQNLAHAAGALPATRVLEYRNAWADILSESSSSTSIAPASAYPSSIAMDAGSGVDNVAAQASSSLSSARAMVTGTPFLNRIMDTIASVEPVANDLASPAHALAHIRAQENRDAAPPTEPPDPSASSPPHELLPLLLDHPVRSHGAWDDEPSHRTSGASWAEPLPAAAPSQPSTTLSAHDSIPAQSVTHEADAGGSTQQPTAAPLSEPPQLSPAPAAYVPPHRRTQLTAHVMEEMEATRSSASAASHPSPPPSSPTPHRHVHFSPDVIVRVISPVVLEPEQLHARTAAGDDEDDDSSGDATDDTPPTELHVHPTMLSPPPGQSGDAELPASAVPSRGRRGTRYAANAAPPPPPPPGILPAAAATNSTSSTICGIPPPPGLQARPVPPLTHADSFIVAHARRSSAPSSEDALQAPVQSVVPLSTAHTPVAALLRADSFSVAHAQRRVRQTDAPEQPTVVSREAPRDPWAELYATDAAASAAAAGVPPGMTYDEHRPWLHRRLTAVPEEAEARARAMLDATADELVEETGADTPPTV